MAVYQSKAGTWFYKFKIRKRQYHKSIPEATCCKDAEKFEACVKADLLRGRLDLVEDIGEISFRELVKEYNEYAQNNRISWRRDLSRVNHLLEFFGTKQLKKITPMLIEKYRFERKRTKTPKGKFLSNASLNRETSILRKMLNIAIDNGWIRENPCLSSKVKPLREERSRERVLQLDEEERLLFHCKDHLAYMKPILICALHTGMRKGEILKLTWDNVDLEAGYIYVTKTKSGKNRSIPISPLLLKELKKLFIQRKGSYVFASPITQEPYSDLKRSFDSLKTKANIDDFVFHSLRHTAATRLVAAGIDLVVVKEILGHSCIETTMRYSHPVPSRKKAAIEALQSYNENFKEVHSAFK